MSSNTSLQFTDLDFSSIKTNFKDYLKSQDKFKDYNFEGSSLSVLLDVLAYNTQYNAYYTQMVANEMFLDSATQRSSVVSHAKLLNYIPKSSMAPTAYISLSFKDVDVPSLTLAKNISFLSESVDGKNYNFITTNSTTVNPSGNTATFTNIELKQGTQEVYTFTVDSTTNPTYSYEIPDNNIDTSTIQVIVKASSVSTEYQIYQPTDKYLDLDNSSLVYFIQEGFNGYYQINFGDGILGKKLNDGNVITISYISTDGTASIGANNFVLYDYVGNYAYDYITTVKPSAGGMDRESIPSIKSLAPKKFSAQNRAVTKNDYISAIQNNNLGLSFDAVSVWGGETNENPAYGQVFISLKPAGSYVITETQKQKLINDVIKPISVMTVSPSIIDPDYTYVQLNINVVYDPTKTNLLEDELKVGIKNSIYSSLSKSLNTFNSSFNSFELMNNIQNYNNSIVNSEFDILLQKKFYPKLNNSSTYQLRYNTPLKKGTFLSGVGNSPSFAMLINPEKEINVNTVVVIPDVYMDEIPSSAQGINSISIINPGYGYQFAPTITIQGDGTGATAEATISNGLVSNINIITPGKDYSSAVVIITPSIYDTTAYGSVAVINFQGTYGTLRSYYYNNKNVKTILNSNFGTIDYDKGILTLTDFNPNDVNNPLGQLTVFVNPKSSIISSTYNSIITIDPFDPNAIIINMIRK